jgi:hypothetical protein
MIQSIKLTPEEGALDGLRVELEGDLAAILAAASGKSKVLKQMNPAMGTGFTASSGVAGHRTQLYRTDVPGLFRASA